MANEAEERKIASPLTSGEVGAIRFRMNKASLLPVLKILFKIIVSVGIIAILVVSLKSGKLIEVLKTVSVWQLAGALLFYLFCQFLSSLRWLTVAYSMGLGKGILHFYQYYLMGMYFSLFLPTAIGGDLGRALLLARDRSSRWTKAFLSIVAERLCGLVGLLAFALGSLFVIRPEKWLLFVFMFLMLMAGALLFLFFFNWIEHHRWGHWFIQKFVVKQQSSTECSVSSVQLQETEHRNAGHCVSVVWPRPRAVSAGIIISFFFHGLSITLQFVLLLLLGADLSFFLVAAIYGISGLASLLPVSLSGIGVREGTITFLLVNWGEIPQEIATAFSLIWLSILLLATIPGGILTLQKNLPSLKIANPASIPKE